MTGRQGDHILNPRPREVEPLTQRPESPTLAALLLTEVTPTS